MVVTKLEHLLVISVRLLNRPIEARFLLKCLGAAKHGSNRAQIADVKRKASFVAEGCDIMMTHALCNYRMVRRMTKRHSISEFRDKNSSSQRKSLS